MLPIKMIIAALYSLAPAALADTAVLKLTTHDLPPYSYRDADQRLQGLAVEVVECALTRMDMPYSIKVTAWARAQKLVEDCMADGFFAGSRNPERDAYAVKSAIIAEQQWRWYLLADNPSDPSTEGFRQQANVSSFIGANMLDWLVDNHYQVASPPKDTDGLLKMLQAKRVDAILANNLVMQRSLQQQGLENEIRSVLLKDKPLGVYFAKRFISAHPGFLERFNTHVGVCRETP
jgi:ABC-type amino acid transport substrate-binding protein